MKKLDSLSEGGLEASARPAVTAPEGSAADTGSSAVPPVAGISPTEPAPPQPTLEAGGPAAADSSTEPAAKSTPGDRHGRRRNKKPGGFRAAVSRKAAVSKQALERCRRLLSPKLYQQIKEVVLSRSNGSPENESSGAAASGSGGTGSSRDEGAGWSFYLMVGVFLILAGTVLAAVIWWRLHLVELLFR